MGLLALLGRWAFLDPNKGGLQTEKARAAAAALFQGFCQEDICFKVQVVGTWQCKWPRSSVDPDATTLELPLQDGAVDLTMLGQSEDKKAVSWVKSMAEKSADIACSHKAVPVLKLFDVIFRFNAFKPLLQQMLWDLAQQWESGLMKLNTKKFDITTGNLMMQLLGYVSSAIVHSSAFQAK